MENWYSSSCEGFRAGSGSDIKVLGETYYKGTSYDVKSNNFPEITNTRLYVKGSDKKDDEIYASRKFDNEVEAKNYITAMNKIIHDINIESFLKKDFHVADEEVEVTIAE